MKEAALHLACRRQLPPPLWWTDKTEASAVPAYPKAPHEPASISSAPPQSSAAPALPQNRGRRSWKREPVEAAMRDDIQEGRLTLAELKVVGEKSLAHKYKVSRDTARKARQAVLSELSIDKNDKRQIPPR
jgi:hypothetical protein